MLIPHWPIYTGPNKDFDHVVQRTLYILQRLGSPHLKLKNVIHITGTKGKGSTALYISNILQSAGYSVNTYISPHIYECNERILFNSKKISDDELYEATETVRYVCEEGDNKNEPLEPSMFEALTCSAFLSFAKRNAVFNIIEVGMGGLKDATNVFDENPPLACIFAPIHLDHTKFLGKKVEDVAWNKSFLIKRGTQNVVLSSQSKEAKCVLKNVAKTLEIKDENVFCYGEDYEAFRSENEIMNDNTCDCNSNSDIDSNGNSNGNGDGNSNNYNTAIANSSNNLNVNNLNIDNMHYNNNDYYHNNGITIKVGSPFFESKTLDVCFPFREPNMTGDYQLINASCAVMTCLACKKSGKADKLSLDAINKGIANTINIVRMQQITNGKLFDMLPKGSIFYVDGAHNKLAAHALTTYINEFKETKNKKYKICVAIARTKGVDNEAFLEELLDFTYRPIVDLVICTRANLESIPEPPETIAKSCKKLNFTYSIAHTIKDVVSQATHFAGDCPVLLICTGSLYIARDICVYNDDKKYFKDK